MRKGLGLHYKPLDALGQGKPASFLRNPHTVPAISLKNLVQYRKLGQDTFQLRGCFAGLQTVRLVHDRRAFSRRQNAAARFAAFLGQLEQLTRDERKLL